MRYFFKVNCHVFLLLTDRVVVALLQVAMEILQEMKDKLISKYDTSR